MPTHIYYRYFRHTYIAYLLPTTTHYRVHAPHTALHLPSTHLRLHLPHPPARIAALPHARSTWACHAFTAHALPPHLCRFWSFSWLYWVRLLVGRLPTQHHCLRTDGMQTHCFAYRLLPHRPTLARYPAAVRRQPTDGTASPVVGPPASPPSHAATVLPYHLFLQSLQHMLFSWHHYNHATQAALTQRCAIWAGLTTVAASLPHSVVPAAAGLLLYCVGYCISFTTTTPPHYHHPAYPPPLPWTGPLFLAVVRTGEPGLDGHGQTAVLLFSTTFLPGLVATLPSTYALPLL